jgi:hypothetical protein
MQKLGHEPHSCQKHKAQSIMTQGEHETKEKKLGAKFINA